MGRMGRMGRHVSPGSFFLGRTGGRTEILHSRTRYSPIFDISALPPYRRNFFHRFLYRAAHFAHFAHLCFFTEFLHFLQRFYVFFRIYILIILIKFNKLYIYTKKVVKVCQKRSKMVKKWPKMKVNIIIIKSQ